MLLSADQYDGVIAARATGLHPARFGVRPIDDGGDVAFLPDTGQYPATHQLPGAIQHAGSPPRDTGNPVTDLPGPVAPQPENGGQIGNPGDASNGAGSSGSGGNGAPTIDPTLAALLDTGVSADPFGASQSPPLMILPDTGSKTTGAPASLPIMLVILAAVIGVLWYMHAHAPGTDRGGVPKIKPPAQSTR